MLDALFVPRCASCGAEGGPLCAGCARGVGVLQPPWCTRCGRPTQDEVGACPDCPPPPLARARAAFLYDGPIADAILALKFRGWAWLARSLAGAMAAVADEHADAITWVPLSRRRRSRRGFDQAQLLAGEVARRLQVPSRRLLRRTRDTAAQATRRGADRRAALDGAFRSVRSAPRSVLLVDDVLTTGATAAACAAVLRDAGAERITLLTAARSLGAELPARCFGGYNRVGPSLGSVVAREESSR